VKPRAVLDTSALIAAERHEPLFAAYKKLYRPVISLFIVGELARVRTELAIRQARIGRSIAPASMPS
jgi:hypothetical protein